MTPCAITPITQPIAIQITQNEGRIALAIQAFQRGQFAHLKTACKKYGAPYTIARERVAGVLLKHEIQPKSKKLTDLEEQTLEQ
jgi:hypothetical protein